MIPHMWDHLGLLYCLTSILASALHWWGPEGQNSTVCSYIYLYIYYIFYIYIIYFIYILYILYIYYIYIIFSSKDIVKSNVIYHLLKELMFKIVWTDFVFISFWNDVYYLTTLSMNQLLLSHHFQKSFSEQTSTNVRYFYPHKRKA